MTVSMNFISSVLFQLSKDFFNVSNHLISFPKCSLALLKEWDFLESPVSRHLYHDLFDNTARDTHSCVGDQFPIMPEKQLNHIIFFMV